MATAIASRFAVLPDDVDDEYTKTKRRPNVKKTDTKKPISAASSKPDPKKKKGKENTQNQNAKMNSQSHKAKTKSKPSNNTKEKKEEPADEQWAEWKEKDSQMVDGSYEDQLTEAILLSKIDYEEKKDYYEQAAKVSEIEKKSNKKNKKTKRIISVEEFHNWGKTQPVEPSVPPVSVDKNALREDPVFLSKVKESVKKELIRENTEPKKIVREFCEETLTVAQLRDALEKKGAELNEVKEENERLKVELLNVKLRNKKLYQILANGEMKEKAEVLVEVERLQNHREELTNEVGNLHVLLEQERSKVRSLMGEKTRDKNKKRTTSSGES